MSNVPSFDTFRLELARPGPLYGQLLSKLTNYLSLCDGVEADTFRLPFDHYEVEEDLAGLRYFVNASAGESIPNEFRLTALRRLSGRLASLVDQLRGFQTRFAESEGNDLTHVRLILNGSELSLVPFELSMVPSGWRGSGAPFVLQSRARTVLTRELRDSSRRELYWNRDPRVLFCVASPDGFAPPPSQAHLVEISRAIQPWYVKNSQGGHERDKKDFITVLERASVDDIARATRAHDYTHVHILAHGAELKKAGKRYGLALHHPRRPNEADIVDARTLARALWAQHQGKKPPTLVTLASCDSANQSSVVLPGSSIGYELHHEGVPWVVASQMPLTFRGSATLTRVLYEGLFKGEDPRWVLHRVRGELARDNDSHDWASLVVYASFPLDFEAQVKAFAIRQIRCFINSAFHRADQIFREPEPADAEGQRRRQADRDRELSIIEEQIERWERRLPSSRGRNDADRGEYLGMRGAVCKQRATLVTEREAGSLLREAASHYRKAAEQQIGSHWVVVQYLSLCQLLELDVEPEWLHLAVRTAALDLDDPATRVWGAGSLLELALLQRPEEPGIIQGKSYMDWAREFARSVSSKRAFEFFSTRRQLMRYAEGFRGLAPDWLRKRAEAVVALLDHDVRD